MKYLELTESSEEYAKKVSEALWEVIHPKQLRSPDDVTTMAYGWVQNEKTGKIGIVLPDEIPVHPLRDFAKLIEVIGEKQPPQVREQLRAHFEAKASEENLDRRTDSLLPPIFKSKITEAKDAEDAGWKGAGNESKKD